MAIKIECKTCGFRNDLGRVFCAQCGQKLDLRDTSMNELEERREFNFGMWIRWGISVVVIVTVSVIIGLALWSAKPVPVYTEAVGSRQVPIKIAAILRALSYNKPMTLDFQEGELNGFLAARAKVKHLNAFTIDLKPGSFDLYAALDWSPPTNLAFLAKIKIPVSFTLQGSFQGGVFMPGKGRVGHLPLVGKAQVLSTDFFATLLPDILAEKRLIDALQTVAIEERQADLTLTPVGK
ncbi:MAG: hypothetical protein WCI03_06685 [bacterium]|jgi:hypothetical protein